MARVAVVTGGTRGIGHAISTALKYKGFRVAANYAGNDAAARQFQAELLRSIHEAEDYHVLWLHDYTGRNAAGEVDRVAFVQAVAGYISPKALNQ